MPASLRVYLDGERPSRVGWTRVYWTHEAIALLEHGQALEISVDHDLGDDARGTGYDVILWMEAAVAERGFQQSQIHVHSANSSARDEMLAGVRAIARLAASRFAS